MTRFLKALALSLCAAPLFFATATLATEQFPNQTIKLVLGYAPGGSADVVARIFANLLSKELSQNVIVENRGGASGTLAANLVLNSRPDGYTLNFVASPTVTLTPAVQKISFDPLRDFTPIASIVDYVSVLVVNSASPYNSVNDLIERARKDPGGVMYGSSGVGSASPLAGELLPEAADVRLTHVAYKGNAPATLDLFAGTIDFMFDLTTTAMANVEGGRLRALAVSSAQRNPMFPAVPTMIELGYKDFAYASWFGLLGPQGMSKEVVQRISDATRKIVESKDFSDRMIKSGYLMAYGTPQEVHDRMAREGRMFSDIAHRIGIGSK